jgi:hypothetical protein
LKTLDPAGVLKPYTLFAKMLAALFNKAGDRETFAQILAGNGQRTLWTAYLSQGYMAGATRAYDSVDPLHPTSQEAAAARQQFLSAVLNSTSKDDVVDQLTRIALDAVDHQSLQKTLLIARREMVRASAEGQLAALKMLDVKTVQLVPEWTTTGDICRKCEQVARLGPMSLSAAAGVVPIHDACMCAWKPILIRGRSS